MNHTQLFSNFNLTPGARISGFFFSTRPDGLTVAQLATAAGFSRESANKYTQELESQNLITATKQPRKHGRIFTWVPATPEAE